MVKSKLIPPDPNVLEFNEKLLKVKKLASPIFTKLGNVPGQGQTNSGSVSLIIAKFDDVYKVNASLLCTYDYSRLKY